MSKIMPIRYFRWRENLFFYFLVLVLCAFPLQYLSAAPALPAEMPKPCPTGTQLIVKRLVSFEIEGHCESADGQMQGPRAIWSTEKVLTKYAEYKNGTLHGEFLQWASNTDEGTYWLQEKGYYQGGEKHGLWSLYHSNGELLEESEYIEGKRNGFWVRWDDTGQIVAEGLYLADQKHGVFRKWSDGVLQEIKEYRENKKNGIWQVNYPDGQPKEQGVYLYEKAEGFWVYWYPNGQIREEGSYLLGKKHGLWGKWNVEGKILAETNYQDGKKHGPFTLWHQDGGLAKGQYFEDKPHGYWFDQYENQQVKEEKFYANGTKINTWTSWYENGQLQTEEHYTEEGKSVGRWYQWYENGQKKEEKHFLRGKLHGGFLQWYETGSKSKEGIYVAGKKEGTFSEWDEQSNQKQKIYHNDKLFWKTPDTPKWNSLQGHIALGALFGIGTAENVFHMSVSVSHMLLGGPTYRTNKPPIQGNFLSLGVGTGMNIIGDCIDDGESVSCNNQLYFGPILRGGLAWTDQISEKKNATMPTFTLYSQLMPFVGYSNEINGNQDPIFGVNAGIGINSTQWTKKVLRSVESDDEDEEVLLSILLLPIALLNRIEFTTELMKIPGQEASLRLGFSLGSGF